ncbi:hypothetical protein ABBQ32_011222 [Trebouxia sp. C0010 RCD-2024]
MQHCPQLHMMGKSYLRLYLRSTKPKRATLHFARNLAATATSSYETIKSSTEGAAGIITISKPKALNALSSQVMQEIIRAAHEHQSNKGVGAIVITGEGNKAFAAGADIKEMASQTYSEACNDRLLEGWQELCSIQKPLIAAVNGYALGGGCEVAMMCDIIIASKTAKFGQPEVQLGVIPGMGGTQRLVRAVGKSKAMEMILTGDRIDADEALRLGLVSTVVEPDQLMSHAIALADKIASYSHPVVAKAKECVNMAEQVGLSAGLSYER